jgi:BolA family transcriptional regulator, general stress-responsive regulator
MTRADWIASTLRAAFHPQHLTVEDESALHAGHAGAASGGGHFRVVIVSERFRDLDLLSRHRTVYAALGEAMRHEIHALALETLTPEEWRR